MGQYQQQQSYPLVVPAPGGGTTTITVTVTFTATFLDPPAGPGITNSKVDITPCGIMETGEFQSALVGPIRDFVQAQIGNSRVEAGVDVGGVLTPADELANQLIDGDGKADIALQNTNGGPAIWEMDGTSIIGSALPPNLGVSWHLKDAQ